MCLLISCLSRHSVSYSISYSVGCIGLKVGWGSVSGGLLLGWVVELTNTLLLANNMAFYYILELHTLCLILHRPTRPSDVILGIDVLAPRINAAISFRSQTLIASHPLSATDSLRLTARTCLACGLPLSTIPFDLSPVSQPPSIYSAETSVLNS